MLYVATSVCHYLLRGGRGDPVPLSECYTKVSLFCSQGNTLTLPTVNGYRKEKMNRFPSQGRPNQGIFCKTDGLFTFFPQLLLSLFL